MKRSALFSLLFVITFVPSLAQAPKGITDPSKSAPPRFEAEKALASQVLEAHGGTKLKAMRTLIIRGSVDVTTSAITQTIPATFVMILSGDRYRIELNNPFQPFKQVYDGVNTISSIQGGLTLPPINRLGFPVLPKIGDTGFIITPLPDNKKRKKGFRMTSPEGYFTDFYLDEKTNQVKGYDSTYDIAGRKVTTSVEIDKYQIVDGIVVPEKYVQRFDTEQMTIYANFKSKEILINTPVADDVFRLQ
jgi:hypothetical protein